MNAPSVLKAWALATRPATLPAGAAPVLLGLAIASTLTPLNWLAAFATLEAAIFVQIGTNLANDYYDFIKGADTEDRLGPARATQRGWLTPAQVALGAGVALTLAGLGGLALTVMAGWPVALIAASSLICAVAYTGGPYPLAYVGLGDLFVLVFFGPVAVCGTVYIQTLRWPIEGLVGGLALGLLSTGILVVNNLRDRHTDAVVNKRTLVVRFGPSVARAEYLLLILGAFALCVGAFAMGWGSAWLTPLIWLPLGVYRIKAVYQTDGAALNPLLGQTAQVLLLFTATLCAGLVLL